jgi:hypothetical protein
MRWIVAVAGCLLWAMGPCPSHGGASVERFLVEGRVHVTLVTLDDGTRGGIIWQDTAMPRRGEAPFLRRGRVLHFRGDAVPPAHLVPGVALVLRNPPWNPSISTVLGVSLD